jgi:3'(2'), 5'-bisphosphate nucleotidase
MQSLKTTWERSNDTFDCKRHMPPSFRLHGAIAVAKRAGEAILRVYEGKEDVGTQTKSDGSPLTNADMAAHHSILSGLRELTPESPVVSEESSLVSYQERRQWNEYWLVDPLDGTKEFVKQTDEFTVNIAWIQDSRPVQGVIHAPALGLTYYACKEAGAFRQRSGESPIKIAVQDPRDKLRIVVSRSHKGERLESYLQRFEDYECVNMGSSLKFCLVAEGSAHFYPRLGRTLEWDTAAGQCIVEVAGGTVTDLQGKAVSYNKLDLSNPDFLAIGARSLRWRKLLDKRITEKALP